jgi:hypothetical protein
MENLSNVTVPSLPQLLISFVKRYRFKSWQSTVKKNDNQEFHFVSGQNDRSKFASHERMMPIIKCVCGAKILVVPDLKAMNKAIRNHVAEHKKTDNLDYLEQFLTKKVLFAASKMNGPNVS